MEKILVCITGAVSAVVMPSYIAQMRKVWKCNIHVMMTKNATKFVTPYALQLHSGNSVFVDNYQIDDSILVPHIKLSNEVDVLLIMPATANIISKIANGISDDLVTTSILATKKPIIFIPSMNHRMWNNAILQENVSKLLKYGYNFIHPNVGVEIQDLTETNGVMPKLNDIILAVEEILIPNEKINIKN